MEGAINDLEILMGEAKEDFDLTEPGHQTRLLKLSNAIFNSNIEIFDGQKCHAGPQPHWNLR